MTWRMTRPQAAARLYPASLDRTDHCVAHARTEPQRRSTAAQL